MTKGLWNRQFHKAKRHGLSQLGGWQYAARRSASTGTARCGGTVVEGRVTPEQVRLVVDVDGVGVVDAVAPLDQHPGPGEAVRLRIDATRTAPVG